MVKRTVQSIAGALLLLLSAQPVSAEEAATLSGETLATFRSPVFVGLPGDVRATTSECPFVDGAEDFPTFPGEGTFTYTASGVASGPYPGTFTETVTVVLGPRVLPGQPDHPFDSPIVSFDVVFRIESGSTVITGEKHLDPTSPFPGECVHFGPSTRAEAAANLRYEATIRTPEATFRDEGSSFISVAVVEPPNPADRTFYFNETYVSALAQVIPLDLRPGRGCGDKNHIHERENDCKKVPT